MNRTLPRLIALVLFTLTATAATAFEKDSLVWKKCTGCHQADDQGRIARVEELRTTPEEWTVIVDRMRRLYGMPIKAGEMAVLLKELCSTQILTPAEAEQVAYIDLFNNPQTMETPAAGEEQMFAACVRCHSAAKIKSYRMTPSAWEKLRDFHLYVDPTVIYQLREMHWRSEADAVLKDLGEWLPYGAAWSAPAASPGGQWLMLGAEAGRGNFRGTASLAAKGDGEYALQGAYTFADGAQESFTGEATLYGGYALRTRSQQNGNPTMGAFRFVDGVIRGAHHHNAPDFRTASSAWYPITGQSRALRTTPGFLLAGEQTTVLVEGTGLPEVAAGDVSVSSGEVEVVSATTTSAESIEVVLVYRGDGHGETALSVKGIEAPGLKLAPGIGYLRVSPETGRARVNGGLNYPAEGVQFEAFAWSAGPDAQDPSDDYLLGPVDATFTLAEEETRPDDDDMAYLGDIARNGTYLPIGDYNPIPAREYGGEATGMVKVVASYTRGETPYSAEARLVVTVPDFIQRIK